MSAVSASSLSGLCLPWPEFPSAADVRAKHHAPGQNDCFSCGAPPGRQPGEAVCRGQSGRFPYVDYIPQFIPHQQGRPFTYAQAFLTGHWGHFGLVRLHSSWPWRLSSRYTRVRASKVAGFLSQSCAGLRDSLRCSSYFLNRSEYVRAHRCSLKAPPLPAEFRRRAKCGPRQGRRCYESSENLVYFCNWPGQRPA